MSVTKQVWIYAAVFLFVGVICYYFAVPHWFDDEHTNEPDGYEDLGDCYHATSLDHKRTLHFGLDHTIRFSDDSGLAMRAVGGTWELLDDDKHIYRVMIEGAATDYTVVKAPVGDACMLVPGGLQSVDLTKSWFPALTDSGD